MIVTKWDWVSYRPAELGAERGLWAHCFTQCDTTAGLSAGGSKDRTLPALVCERSGCTALPVTTAVHPAGSWLMRVLHPFLIISLKSL